MKLLENPLVKIIGILAVLYFALFSNKENPQSLGSRLSAEKIKKSFGEMGEKSRFIASNVKAARSHSLVQEDGAQKNERPVVEVTIKDFDQGVGKNTVACGSEVSAFVSLSSSSGKNLNSKTVTKIVVGSKKDWLIEKNIIGMKSGGVRSINVPQGFQSDDAELMRLLKENNSDLSYQIVLKEITSDPAPKSNLNCE